MKTYIERLLTFRNVFLDDAQYVELEPVAKLVKDMEFEIQRLERKEWHGKN